VRVYALKKGRQTQHPRRTPNPDSPQVKRPKARLALKISFRCQYLISTSELQRAVSTSGKPVQVQRLIFVPDGLVRCKSIQYTVTDQTQNSKGNPNRTTLSPEYIDHLLEFGLAKLSQPSEPLIFHQGDSNAQICDIVKTHFRRPIEWLETHPYKPERNAGLDVQHQLWRLCIKTQRTIGLSYDPFPNGAKLHNVCAPAGRPVDQRSLIISARDFDTHVLKSNNLIPVSKQRIPEERYRDWDAPEPVTGSSDYELSTDDSESDNTPKKGKNGEYPFCSRFTRARLISRVLVAVKKEGGGSGLVRKVGGRSTRMSTGMSLHKISPNRALRSYRHN
jgi:hypothetical protein